MFIVFWITLLFRIVYRWRKAITEFSVDRVGRWWADGLRAKITK